MTKIIKDLYISFNSIFEHYFSTDNSLISKDGQQILSNQIDKEKYFEALNKLKELKENSDNREILTEDIKLSSGKDITIVY